MFVVDGDKEKMAEGEGFISPDLNMIGPLLHTKVTGWEHFVRWLREMCGFLREMCGVATG